MSDMLRRYLRLGEDDDIGIPPTGTSVMLWRCPYCAGQLREHYPREPKLGDRGICGYCNEVMDMGENGPCESGKQGVLILVLPSGEAVVGVRDPKANAFLRWTTNEQVFPTHFKILSFFDLWQGSHDDWCPDLIELKKAFPDMDALLKWHRAQRH